MKEEKLNEIISELCDFNDNLEKFNENFERLTNCICGIADFIVNDYARYIQDEKAMRGGIADELLKLLKQALKIWKDKKGKKL